MCKGVDVRLKSGSADAFVNREPDVPAAFAPITAGRFIALRALNEQIDAYDRQLEKVIETTFPEAQRGRQVRGLSSAWSTRRDQSGAIDKQLGIGKTGYGLRKSAWPSPGSTWCGHDFSVTNSPEDCA